MLSMRGSLGGQEDEGEGGKPLGGCETHLVIENFGGRQSGVKALLVGLVEVSRCISYLFVFTYLPLSLLLFFFIPLYSSFLSASIISPTVVVL